MDVQAPEVEIMDYKMLGKRLKEIRKMRDMSQQDLSYEIEYSIPHISHVENGSTKASLDFVVKAANALGTTTDHLLCDSLEDSGSVYLGEISQELEQLDGAQLKIIRRMIRDMKENLEENM
jgi:transcriptional regulator with XRE-family HTH domain